MNREDLPVEIFDKEMPEDEMKHYNNLLDGNNNVSGGFADAIFLGAIMVVCFLWGMLAVILK